MTVLTLIKVHFFDQINIQKNFNHQQTAFLQINLSCDSHKHDVFFI